MVSECFIRDRVLGNMRKKFIIYTISVFIFQSCTNLRIMDSELKKSSVRILIVEEGEGSNTILPSKVQVQWENTDLTGKKESRKETVPVKNEKTFSQPFWSFALTVFLFIPSKALFPIYYREESEITVGISIKHRLEREHCGGILIFNCAFFEGFESGISANRRLQEEIYPALLEDYLVRTGRIPERKD